MTSDRFAEWDAAYALGALEPAERAQFEQHLAGCVGCHLRVAQAAQTVAILGAAPTAVIETPDERWPDPPDTLLPGLLRRARRERRRGQALTRSLAAVTAACVLTLVVVLWPASGSRPVALRLRAVVKAPIAATAVLQSKAWGTEIHVHCKYDRAGSTYAPYRLEVVDRAGKAYDAGTWTVTRGHDTDFTGGTEVRRERIAKLQVTLADGTPILQLDL